MADSIADTIESVLQQQGLTRESPLDEGTLEALLRVVPLPEGFTAEPAELLASLQGNQIHTIGSFLDAFSVYQHAEGTPDAGEQGEQQQIQEENFSASGASFVSGGDTSDDFFFSAVDGGTPSSGSPNNDNSKNGTSSNVNLLGDDFFGDFASSNGNNKTTNHNPNQQISDDILQSNGDLLGLESDTPTLSIDQSLNDRFSTVTGSSTPTSLLNGFGSPETDADAFPSLLSNAFLRFADANNTINDAQLGEVMDVIGRSGGNDTETVVLGQAEIEQLSTACQRDDEGRISLDAFLHTLTAGVQHALRFPSPVPPRARGNNNRNSIDNRSLNITNDDNGSSTLANPRSQNDSLTNSSQLARDLLAEQQLSEAQKQNNAMADELKAAKDELLKSKKEMQRLAEMNEKAAHLSDALEDAKVELLQHQESESSLRRVNARVEASSEEKTKLLHEQIQQLENEKGLLQRTISTTQASTANAMEELHRLEEVKESLEERANQAVALANEMSKMAREKAALEEQASTMHSKLGELEAKVQEYEMQEENAHRHQHEDKTNARQESHGVVAAGFGGGSLADELAAAGLGGGGGGGGGGENNVVQREEHERVLESLQAKEREIALQREATRAREVEAQRTLREKAMEVEQLKRAQEEAMASLTNDDVVQALREELAQRDLAMAEAERRLRMAEQERDQKEEIHSFANTKTREEIEDLQKQVEHTSAGLKQERSERLTLVNVAKAQEDQIRKFQLQIQRAQDDQQRLREERESNSGASSWFSGLLSCGGRNRRAVKSAQLASGGGRGGGSGRRALTGPSRNSDNDNDDDDELEDMEEGRAARRMATLREVPQDIGELGDTEMEPFI